MVYCVMWFVSVYVFVWGFLVRCVCLGGGVIVVCDGWCLVTKARGETSVIIKSSVNFVCRVWVCGVWGWVSWIKCCWWCLWWSICCWWWLWDWWWMSKMLFFFWRRRFVSGSVGNEILFLEVVCVWCESVGCICICWMEGCIVCVEWWLWGWFVNSVCERCARRWRWSVRSRVCRVSRSFFFRREIFLGNVYVCCWVDV